VKTRERGGVDTQIYGQEGTGRPCHTTGNASPEKQQHMSEGKMTALVGAKRRTGVKSQNNQKEICRRRKEHQKRVAKEKKRNGKQHFSLGK